MDLTALTVSASHQKLMNRLYTCVSSGTYFPAGDDSGGAMVRYLSIWGSAFEDNENWKAEQARPRHTPEGRRTRAVAVARSPLE